MKLRVKEVVLTERISEIDVEFPYFAWSNNNKYVIGGDFSNYKGTPANMVIRLNQDGSIDNTF